MKKSRFTETQIVAVLKEADAGKPVKEICRKYGATMFVNYARDKMRDKVKELTGGKVGAHVIRAVPGCSNRRAAVWVNSCTISPHVAPVVMKSYGVIVAASCSIRTSVLPFRAQVFIHPVWMEMVKSSPA